MKLHLVKKLPKDGVIAKIKFGYILVCPFQISLLNDDLDVIKSKDILIGVDQIFLTSDEKYVIIIDDCCSIKSVKLPDLEEEATFTFEKESSIKNVCYFLSQDRLGIYSSQVNVNANQLGYLSSAPLEPSTLLLLSVPELQVIHTEKIDHKFTNMFSSPDTSDLFLVDKESVHLKTDDGSKKLDFHVISPYMVRKDDNYYVPQELGLYVLDTNFNKVDEIRLTDNYMSSEEKDILRSLKMAFGNSPLGSNFMNQSEKNTYALRSYDATDDYLFMIYTHTITSSKKLYIINRHTGEEVLNFSTNTELGHIMADEKHIFIESSSGICSFTYSK